jgi:hypothetical protein
MKKYFLRTYGNKENTTNCAQKNYVNELLRFTVAVLILQSMQQP